YQLQEKVGSGGAAEVYKAVDTRLGRVVAIKLLRDTYAQDPTFTQRFENEARAAARLSHPNIVDVYDYDRSDGRYFIAMEYVPGPNLKEYLTEHAPLAESEVREWGLQILSGLGAAHQAGLVHRDMKPQNVLLGSGGGVKIADFGIAKAMGDAGMTEAGIAFGTPHYLSPEQARGDEVTPRSDLYAVGVMLYEMLSGRLPFEGDNPMRVAYAHVFESPRPLREVAPQASGELVRVVERAMAKDPLDRFQSAQEMAAAIHTATPAPAVQVPANAPTVMMPVVHEAEPEPLAEPAATEIVESHTARYAAPEEKGGRGWLLWAVVPLLLLLFLGGCYLLQGPLRDWLATPGPAATATTELPIVLPPTGEPTTAPTAAPTQTPTRAASPTATATRVPAPGQVSGFIATLGAPTRVELQWRDVEGEDRYLLQRRQQGEDWRTIGEPRQDTTDWIDTEDVSLSTTYNYRIRSVGTGGSGPWSTVSIRTPNPTSTPTPTPTPTNTPVPTPTYTPTPSPTATYTPTPQPTPTNTPTPRPTTPPAPTTTILRLEDGTFTGGYSNPDGYKGRSAQWIYAQPTDYDRMRADFSIDGRLVGDRTDNATLRIEGMDSENSPKTRIRISLNNHTVFEGPNPLPNDTNDLNDSGNWGTKSFQFPVTYLRQGNNRLEIVNLETEGKLGEPPFFMLDYAELTFRQIVAGS
ncbi:MAG: protein kinase, partial [Chloroflexota bacterium]|nr:protein kinase [Chloroflexota bacterium]